MLRSKINTCKAYLYFAMDDVGRPFEENAEGETNVGLSNNLV